MFCLYFILSLCIVTYCQDTSANQEQNKYAPSADTVLCPVKYENKCFIPVLDREVNYDGGVAICKSLGGHLANIYNQTHMDYVMKYIREYRMGRYPYVNFRLGMKYDHKAKKLTLRDGSDAPAGLKWRPSYPLIVEVWGEVYAGYTNVILAVESEPFSAHQYLVNDTPSATHYVLCEIE